MSCAPGKGTTLRDWAIRSCSQQRCWREDEPSRVHVWSSTLQKRAVEWRFLGEYYCTLNLASRSGAAPACQIGGSGSAIIPQWFTAVRTSRQAAGSQSCTVGPGSRDFKLLRTLGVAAELLPLRRQTPGRASSPIAISHEFQAAYRYFGCILSLHAASSNATTSTASTTPAFEGRIYRMGGAASLFPRLRCLPSHC